MLTDNPVLVRKHKKLPALMCAQRKAEKRISTEADFIQSNIDSFGNDIGQTTNWVTSMYEVQSKFKEGSAEYRELEYRIMCGQLYQQNAIDKAKGIVCKPMPRQWHDRHSVNKIENEKTRVFYRSIVADKKPYFMRYVYPALMTQYNTYIKNTNRNALREFQMTVNELQQLPYQQLTERQRDFLRYYDYQMPVGTGDCIMNKICRRFESEFDSYIGRYNTSTAFDYRIMKADVNYVPSQFRAIKGLYKEYNKRLQNYKIRATYERIDSDDACYDLQSMYLEFRQACDEICSSDAALGNILLDLCYTHDSTKKFVWDMCGNVIIHNLLDHNHSIISFPTRDPFGDIQYGGERYTVKSKEFDVA